MNDKLLNILKLIPTNELFNLLDIKLYLYINNNENINLINYFYNNFKDYIKINPFYKLFIKYALTYDELFFYNLDEYNEGNINLILTYLSISNKKEEIKKNNYQELALNKRFFELLNYQFIIKEKVNSFINESHKKNLIVTKLLIHMPTGSGKTKTTTHIIIDNYINEANKGIIIWLAHTDELLSQANAAFRNNWSVLGNKTINVFTDIDTMLDNNAIYFLSYQKLISLRKKKNNIFNFLRDNSAYIVCDEAHKTLALETKLSLNELSKVYIEGRTKVLLGLSATPGRKFNEFNNFGENAKLSELYDKNIISIDLKSIKSITSYVEDNTIFEDDKVINFLQENNILAKIKREVLTYDYNNNDYINIYNIYKKIKNRDFSLKELELFGTNYYRNIVIINRLIKLHNDNIPTILFCCSNEQGRLISSILDLYNIPNKAVFGDTNINDRKEYLKMFDEGKYNILINNQILTTGFDSPRIKCVFITRPTNSIVLYSQMLGRGLRGPKMGGNSECLLIDIKDNLMKYNNEEEAFTYFSSYWK